MLEMSNQGGRQVIVYKGIMRWLKMRSYFGAEMRDGENV